MHSTLRRCSWKRSPILLPVSPMYIFLHKDEPLAEAHQTEGEDEGSGSTVVKTSRRS